MFVCLFIFRLFVSLFCLSFLHKFYNYLSIEINIFNKENHFLFSLIALQSVHIILVIISIIEAQLVREGRQTSSTRNSNLLNLYDLPSFLGQPTTRSVPYLRVYVKISYPSKFLVAPLHQPHTLTLTYLFLWILKIQTSLLNF